MQRKSRLFSFFSLSLPLSCSLSLFPSPIVFVATSLRSALIAVVKGNARQTHKTYTLYKRRNRNEHRIRSRTQSLTTSCHTKHTHISLPSFQRRQIISNPNVRWQIRAAKRKRIHHYSFFSLFFHINFICSLRVSLCSYMQRMFALFGSRFLLGHIKVHIRNPIKNNNTKHSTNHVEMPKEEHSNRFRFVLVSHELQCASFDSAACVLLHAWQIAHPQHEKNCSSRKRKTCASENVSDLNTTISSRIIEFTYIYWPNPKPQKSLAVATKLTTMTLAPSVRYHGSRFVVCFQCKY